MANGGERSFTIRIFKSHMAGKVLKFLTNFLFSFSEIIDDEQNFGGIIGFTKEQYEKINGFSNLFFG